ncbi:unnamed protein product [Pieris brassicae]|uniref:Uncharacterized protein n=1 Tax=Pieris brassicae TaxID=7116 RepID=A0A9P0TGD1_PIEBR|nr:unnamed protein product [Pieris brassicae]
MCSARHPRPIGKVPRARDRSPPCCQRRRHRLHVRPSFTPLATSAVEPASTSRVTEDNPHPSDRTVCTVLVGYTKKLTEITFPL